MTSMRRRRSAAVLLSCSAATSLLGAAVACGSSSSDDGSSSTKDPPDAAAAPDVSQPDLPASPVDGSPVVETPLVLIRFANLAPGLGSVDFCWRPTDEEAYRGPLLGTVDEPVDAGSPVDAARDAETDGEADAAADDAGDASDAASDSGSSSATDAGLVSTRPLAYQAISKALFLPDDGSLSVIAVTAGAGCATPLASAHFDHAGGYETTVIVTALAGSPSTAGLFDVPDDPLSVSSTDPFLRVVNAAFLADATGVTASLGVAGSSVPLGEDVVLGAFAAGSDAGDPTATVEGYTRFAATSSPATLALTFSPPDAGFAPVSIELGAPLAPMQFSTAYVGHDARGFFVALSNDGASNLVNGPVYTVVR